MVLDEGKTRMSAEVTGSESSPIVPSISLYLEEKDKSKTATVGDNSANDTTSEHPEGWKLWVVYITTLLTMFLVGFDSTPSRIKP